MPTHPARWPQRQRGSPWLAARPGWSREAAQEAWTFSLGCRPGLAEVERLEQAATCWKINGTKRNSGAEGSQALSKSLQAKN